MEGWGGGSLRAWPRMVVDVFVVRGGCYWGVAGGVGFFCAPRVVSLCEAHHLPRVRCAVDVVMRCAAGRERRERGERERQKREREGGAPTAQTVVAVVG